MVRKSDSKPLAAPPSPERLVMDFEYSPEVQSLQQRLDAFMERYVVPYNGAWHQSVAQGIYPPPFLEDLKALAQAEGLWNLFLPSLHDDEPGRRLSNLAYAPLAEIMGRLPWASEVFNCSAPDTGNMELLHLFATPEQNQSWLQPLLKGEIRSAFAMSEPDVASSDPTNLQTCVRRSGDELVLNGRKWFITGAAHPHCKLLIVMCRSGEPADDKHAQHSLLLVPMDTPGVTLVRNISIMQYHAPEGHCEIVFSDVRLPLSAIKVVAARLQTSVVNRAMQVFGAMGFSPDTPLAYFWTWGRALHLLDGPVEVHLRTVARYKLDLTREALGSTAAYFTLPAQLQAEPRIR